MWPQVWPSVNSSCTGRLQFTLAVAFAHRCLSSRGSVPCRPRPRPPSGCCPSGRTQWLQRGAAVPWPPCTPHGPQGSSSASRPCRHPDLGHPIVCSLEPLRALCGLGSSGADKTLVDPKLSTIGSPRAPIFQLSQLCQPLLSPDSGLGRRSYVPVMSPWRAS